MWNKILNGHSVWYCSHHAECLQETETVGDHFVFRECSSCSVYEGGGSAHGSPLLIFPMVARLTLRGLDSALLLALPGYSPASIALFDSPSGVLSRLRALQQSPSSRWDPESCPPSTTTIRASEKTPAPQAERRRPGVGPRLSLKSSKTKAEKTKKKEKGKLRYRADPTLVCLSDSTIYGRAWDTAGAKLTVYTLRAVPKDRPSDREAERERAGREGETENEGRWKDRETEGKKKKKKSEGGQSKGRWEVTGIEKMEDQRGKESRQDKRKGERRKDSGRLREMKQGKRGAGWGKPSLQPSENNPTCCNCVISELSRTQTELCTHARKMILEDNEHGWNDAWACRFLLVFRNKDLKDSLGTFLPVQFNLTSVLF